MNIANNITELIGNTPLVRLNTPSALTGATILGKCEFMNPTSSIKDRIGFNMIKEAMRRGDINKDTNIIEPTSGNTGIALASQCASLGLNLTLTMPDSMSIERRALLVALGASLVLTPAKEGMKGAIKKANELAQKDNSLILQQFENKDNPAIHEKTTAQEILNDMDGKIDIAVIACGTGGSLSGIAKVLKEKIKGVKIVAVEPELSAVISGNSPSPHKIQGIGAGFIPKNLNINLIDEIITVSNENALDTARSLAKNEGLIVGISSGANVYASIQVLATNKNKNIITILCDTGERYLSTDLFTS